MPDTAYSLSNILFNEYVVSGVSDLSEEEYKPMVAKGTLRAIIAKRYGAAS